jgi:hypothetical protein
LTGSIFKHWTYEVDDYINAGLLAHHWHFESSMGGVKDDIFLGGASPRLRAAFSLYIKDKGVLATVKSVQT